MTIPGITSAQLLPPVETSHTSVYPLAEWIAFNWWSLKADLRPSALPSSVWKWSNVANHEWLRRHNLRGAGGGMPWPDLTLVCEGVATRAVWHGGPGLAGQPVVFLSNGDTYLRSARFFDELTHFVDQVLDRLHDAQVYDTALAKEWLALRDADDEEAAFSAAAARLGLDPYAMTKEAQGELISVSRKLDRPLLDEFLDSADPEDLRTAMNWLEQARQRVLDFSHVTGLGPIGPWRQSLAEADLVPDDRPWIRGYTAAREVRTMLGIAATEQLALDSLIPKVTLAGRTAGLEGYIRYSPRDQLVLVLPTGQRSPAAVRFAQARSIGLALASNRNEHILDPASTDLSKESRAFAAELLAPAAGVAQYLSRLPAVTDSAFDAVAARFRTSSWLVRYQYENQIAAAS